MRVLLRVPCWRPLGVLALAAAFTLSLVSPLVSRLHAEEGTQGEDPRQKLKAQVEKVLRLMRENEEALLKASTEGGQAPKGPEVPIPDVPPQAQPPSDPPPDGQPQGDGSSAGAGGTGEGGTGQGGTGQAGGRAGAAGEGVRRALEELLKGAGESGGSGSIPGELEELMRLVPTQGGSGGSGGGEQGKGEGEQESPEAREAQRRKMLEEQQRREQEQKGQKPEGGQRDPNDPNERAKQDPESPPPDAQDPNVRPWHAELPPELREFFAGGGLEKLPPRLRKIVEDYQRSLDRQTRPAEGPTR